MNRPITIVLCILLLVFIQGPIYALAQVCSPGFQRSAGVCQECPPGTFKRELGEGRCEFCPSGKYLPFSGSKSSQRCIECPIGTYSSERGAVACNKCPDGTVSLPGYTKCVKCGPGTQPDSSSADCETCRVGYFNDGSSQFCQKCRSGTTSNKKGTACVACRPGTFKDVKHIKSLDRRACFKCPPSTYSNKPGAIQCPLCPLGMMSETGATKCTPCPKGTFRGTPLQRKCVPCKDGTSSLGIRPAGCKHPVTGCPRNTFEKDGECQACLPGERLNPKKTKCFPCGENEISDGGDATKCNRCMDTEVPVNSRFAQEKSQCQCAPGYSRDTLGFCNPCLSGTVWNDRPRGALRGSLERVFSSYFRERSSCSSCPGMMFTNKTRASECERCPPGMVSGHGDTECIKCPEKTNAIFIPIDDEDYDSSQSALRRCITEKTNCPMGEIIDENGSCSYHHSCPADTIKTQSGCVKCTHAQFLDKKRNQCEFCPAGTGNTSRHLNTTCKKCVGTGPFIAGCTCSSAKFNVGGKCVKCSKDQASSKGAICKVKLCPPGQIVKSRNSEICRKCDKDSIKISRFSTTCSKCPSGQTAGRNLFYKRTDRCVPKVQK